MQGKTTNTEFVILFKPLSHLSNQQMSVILDVFAWM